MYSDPRCGFLMTSLPVKSAHLCSDTMLLICENSSHLPFLGLSLRGTGWFSLWRVPEVGRGGGGCFVF